MIQKTFLKNFLLLFIFLTIIVLPNWIYFLLGEHTEPTKTIIGQIIGSYLVLFLPFIFFYKHYKWYFIFLIIINIFLLPVELSFFHLYHDRFDLVGLTVALETNIEEALGFISGYEYILALGIIIHLSIMIILYKNIQIKKTNNLRYIGLISLIFILFLAYRSSNIIGQSYGYTLYKNVITNKSPWLMFRLTYDYLYNMQELQRYKTIHEKFTFHAKKEDIHRQTHILVIAESSRYDHWSLHGYNRITNPLLSKESNLISMSKAITGAGATNWSTPLMITPATASYFDESIQKHSVIGAYREAHYQTHWLSNQDKFPYLVLHADEAEYITFIKDKDINAYDEVLLPKVKKIFDTSKKNDIFIVLHIMGNHWKYDERYPKEYDKYQPSIYRQFARMDDYELKEKIINSYDNSMLYTDYFFFQLIKMAKNLNTPATITYVSDHGENLYDTKKNLFGHGRTVSKYINPIPWIIWYSDSYKEIYPDKIQNLLNNKNKKISSANNLFNSILDIGQIIYPNIDTNRSIMSSTFKEEPRFVLSGLNPVDYDKQIKEKKGN